MTDNIDLTEQMTVLQYTQRVLEVTKDDEVSPQDLIDAMLRMTLTYRDAPRVYEVRQDDEGNSSIIWVLKPMGEWNKITIQHGLLRLMERLTRQPPRK